MQHEWESFIFEESQFVFASALIVTTEDAKSEKVVKVGAKAYSHNELLSSKVCFRSHV